MPIEPRNIIRTRILLIVLAGLLTYASSFKNGFLWDDDNFITKNTVFQSVDNPFEFFTDNTKFCKIENYQKSIYRPLRSVIYWVSYKIFGLSPLPLHLFSFLLHCLNSILVFVILRKVLKEETAFLASVLFTVHPAYSEAVFSINYMSDPLFVFFVFVCFYLLVRGDFKVRNMAVFVSSFILALLSKEAALSFLFLYLIYTYIFWDEGKAKAKNPRLLMVLMLLVFSIAYFLLRKEITQSLAQLEITRELLTTNILLVPVVFFKYLALIFYPFSLSAFYEVDPRAYGIVAIVLGYICVAVSISLSLIFARRFKIQSFFWLWFFVGLLPVLGFLPLATAMAERFLYFPSIGVLVLIAMAFGFLGERFGMRSKKIGFAVQVLPFLLAAILMSQTIQRGKLWGRETELFKDALAQYPYSRVLNQNLAASYYERGNYKKSIPCILNAIRLGARSENNYSAAGYMLYHEARYDECVRVSSECLRLYPKSSMCRNNSSICLLRKKSTGKH